MFVKSSAVLYLANAVMAVCPASFNYSIGEIQSLGKDINKWTVYDASCKPADGLISNENPCNLEMFGCSPPPIVFNKYTNSFTGLKYTCRTDPNSGICENNFISVCCVND